MAQRGTLSTSSALLGDERTGIDIEESIPPSTETAT